MNLKYINNFLLIFISSFLLSCNSVNLLSKQQKNYITVYEDLNEEIYTIDTNNYFNTNIKIDDFYQNLNISNWVNDKDFLKLHTFKFFNNKQTEERNFLSLIHNDKIIIVNKHLNFNIYDFDNYELLSSIKLDLEENIENFIPISLARINDNFFLSYSNGLLINFDIDGKILWKQNFNDIIKTPIKIYNDNIILLLSDNIISINPLSGNINWQFIYEQKNTVLQSTGGHLIDLNHLLFFILPNGKIGEVNTLLGEKNYSNFQNINIDQSIINTFDKLHKYNNYISYFDQNSYLTTIDLSKDKILLNKKRIKNINSSYFYNNSLFVIQDKNQLKSYNIINQNLFWEINLEALNIKSDQIVNISSFNNSIIIFFKNGKLVEFESKTGNVISIKDLKIKNINHIQFINSYIFVYSHKSKITILTQ